MDTKIKERLRDLAEDVDSNQERVVQAIKDLRETVQDLMRQMDAVDTQLESIGADVECSIAEAVDDIIEAIENEPDPVPEEKKVVGVLYITCLDREGRATTTEANLWKDSSGEYIHGFRGWDCIKIATDLGKAKDDITTLFKGDDICIGAYRRYYA